MKISHKLLLESFRRTRDSDRYELVPSEALHSEIMHSVRPETVSAGNDEVDVKLILNGVECEPKLLEYIFESLDEQIETRARALYQEKWGIVEDKLEALSGTLDEVKYKILNDLDS